MDSIEEKKLRQFGLTVGSVLGTVGVIRRLVAWVGYGESLTIPYVVLSLAVVFIGLGLFSPRVLFPLYVLAQMAGLALGSVVTYVLLTLAFFFIVVPARVWVKVFLEDPLKREWDSSRQTYWEPVEAQERKPDSYWKPY